MNGAGIIHQFVDQARQLYSLPAVAMEVLTLTQQESVDIGALKTCLEKDPALTAKILRVVNSSMFGLSRKVSDLNQAVALLGVKRLKLLVLGFSLPPQLFSDLEDNVLSLYWRRSLTKAVACREIDEASGGSGDEAFIAGLLQGIGMLVLIQDLGESYAEFLSQVREEGTDLLALEVLSLGFDHQVLSARLLEAWLLPESLTAAVGARCDTASVLALPGPQRKLPQALHLAELLTAVLVDQRVSAFGELEYAIESYNVLSLANLETIVKNLEEKVDNLADVLNLRLADSLTYSDLLAQAQAALAGAASDYLVENSMLRDLSDLQREVTEAASPPTPLPLAGPHRTTAAAENDGPDPGTIGRLELAVAQARRDRQPLSLLLCHVDRFDDHILQRGFRGAQEMLEQVEAELSRRAETPVLHEGDGRFVVIARDCDRRDAVELGRRLTHGVSEWSALCGPTIITLSCGLACVALPPRNFQASDLLEAADRCLYGAQVAGGNIVKSIEI